MRVFLAGEGEAELGRWAEPPQYRHTSSRSNGVLFALFEKAGRKGEIIDARLWRLVPKYRAGGHETADQKTLRKLAVLAEESGADLLLWARDTDHEKDRQRALRETHQSLRAEDDALEIIGEPAHPCVEAWVLAIAAAHANPEALSKPRLKALAQEHKVSTSSQMVELIDARPLDASRSSSLARFVEQLAGS